MTDYLTLTEFVPGTKAKAQEVNANFSAVKEAIATKATAEGDSTQVFSVAEATEDTHAVNKSQLDALSETLTQKINAATERFCVKSGNVTNGAGDLFSYSGTTVTAKVGGAYPNLVVANYKGEFKTITSLANLSVSGKTDGTYNLYVNLTATTPVLYTLANTIYKQKTRPTMNDGDVWFKTSVEPLSAIKYSGTTDAEFLDVPLGSVTILSGIITGIKTFPFNQNGFDVNTGTTVKAGTDLALSVSNLAMPNYANGVGKVWGNAYQAECDGYLYIQADFSIYLYISMDNSLWGSYMISRYDGLGYGGGAFVPIPKNVYYKAVPGGSRSLNIVFYPCLSN